MHEGVEARAAGCRLATRTTDWIAAIGDADRLERWIKPFIQLHREPYREGRRPLPRYRVESGYEWPQVILPHVVSAVDRRLWLPHEVGHILMNAALSRLQIDLSGQHPTQNRMARENGRKEEGVADRFMLAWLLPPRVFRELDDLRLISQRAQLPLELVQLRAAQVIPDYELQEPPGWSAACAYDLHFSEQPIPALHVLFAASGQPAFYIPVGRTRAYREFQVKADLVALSPPEFGRRYRVYQHRPGDPAGVSLGPALPIEIADLRRWALEIRPSQITDTRQLDTEAKEIGDGKLGMQVRSD